MKHKQQENVYYARSNEIYSIKQKTIIGNINSRGYMSIRVPNKWIKDNGSRIIALFYKTGKNIVCPHFWELKAWTGCPFNCIYCYLQGTFRGAERKRPRIKNEKIIKIYLEEFLAWAEENGLIVLLNAGELADSLGVPPYVEKFLGISLPILKKHSKHRILFLTKGGTDHVKVLEKIPRDMRGRFIVSLSINPQVIVERFEIGTASSSDRIEAARLAQEMGFEVRIRIDPMIPVEGWILYYGNLFRELLNKVKPTRITLGTLRALKKTVRYAQDLSWIKYVPEPSPWGKRVERGLRVRMYELAIEILKEHGFKGHIALCKETPKVWQSLQSKGLIENPGTPGVWENVMCNCKL